VCPLEGSRLSRQEKGRVNEESRIMTGSGTARASAGTVKVHVRRAERKVGNILMSVWEGLQGAL